MWGAVLVTFSVIFIVAILHATASLTSSGRPLESEGVYTVGVAILLVLAFACLICWKLLLRDVFRYQYYPIRFNRREMKVHIFTGGGAARCFLCRGKM